MNRIPLHDVDSERALLGALLFDPRRISEVEHLAVEDFYFGPHQVIWAAMQALAGKPFDAVAVKAQVSARGMLTDQVAAALLEAEQSALSPAGLKVHGKAISERSLRRRLVAAGQKIQRLAMEPADATADLLDAAEKEVFSLAQLAIRGKREPVDSRTVVREAIQHVAKLQEQRVKGELPGLTWGLASLDQATSGLNAGELWVLAARPGVGKSALALNVALAAAKSGKASVLIHSLEMPRHTLGLRAIAGEAQVPLERIRGGRLSNYQMDQFTTGASRVQNLPIWWDDDASVTVMDLRAKARRIKQRDPGLGLIVVDYLQIARSTGRATQRHLEIAEVTRGLKELAMELRLPILALSQLSRDVEKQGNRRPRPSDLRESGAIEQDADGVVFIHRPDDEPPVGDGGAIACEILIAKQRNGDAGVVIPVTYQGRWTRFEDGQSAAASQEPPPPEEPERPFQRKYARGRR